MAKHKGKKQKRLSDETVLKGSFTWGGIATHVEATDEFVNADLIETCVLTEKIKDYASLYDAPISIAEYTDHYEIFLNSRRVCKWDKVHVGDRECVRIKDVPTILLYVGMTIGLYRAGRALDYHLKSLQGTT